MTRMLMFSIKFLSSFVKASVVVAVGGTLLIVASHLCSIAYIRCSGYSDNELYLAAKDCVVDAVDALELNEEVENVFSDGCWTAQSASSFYSVPNGGFLDKVRRALPSSGTWSRAKFDGHNALVLRFGCHYNYAWLVVVDPSYCIRSGDDRIERITDNIGVCCNSGNVLYY